MTILPIGIYGPYPKAGGATSCYLVDDGSIQIVLDLGSGALSRLKKHIKPENVAAYILTHLHFDHFCDALPLSYTPNTHVIYAPTSPADCFSLLKNRPSLDMRAICESVTLRLGKMTIEFLLNAHPVETYAVKITEGDRFFVYTSDTTLTDRLACFARGAQLIIADCSSAEGVPHMTPACGESLSRQCGSKVIATHINPDYACRAACARAGIEQIRQNKKIIVW